MKINVVSDASDPKRFVGPNETAYSDNGIELIAPGLFSCTAVIVKEGDKRLMCHAYADKSDPSKSTDPTEIADFVREKFSNPVTVYTAAGCRQNDQQRSDLIAAEVVRQLGANHVSLGMVPNDFVATTEPSITDNIRSLGTETTVVRSR